MAARANLSNRRIAACAFMHETVWQASQTVARQVVKHASCCACKHSEDVFRAMRYPTWSSRPILGDTVRGTQGMVQPAVHTWAGAAKSNKQTSNTWDEPGSSPLTGLMRDAPRTAPHERPAGSAARRTHGGHSIHSALDAVLMEAVARPCARQPDATLALQGGAMREMPIVAQGPSAT